jgi:hypothetical protein
MSAMRPVFLLGLALAWLTGCFDPGVLCGTGRCPTGTVCDVAHARCIYEEQRTTCQGIADGTECEIAGQRVGVCRDEVCLRSFCGDGIIVAPEECDGAELAGKVCTDVDSGFHGPGTLRCSDACELDTSLCGDRCGDGIVQGPDEECDDADLAGQTCETVGRYGGVLHCTERCQFDVTQCGGFCGDGVRNAGEVCDGGDVNPLSCTTEGFYGGVLACNSTCDAVDVTGCVGECGDDEQNGPEICDGDDMGSLRCETYGWYGGELHCKDNCVSVDTSACAYFCGDGVVNGTEICDGFDQAGQTCIASGAEGGALGCNSYCQPTRDRCLWSEVREVPFPPLRSIASIWGSGPDDVWAVGGGSAFAHFDGSSWQKVDPPLGLLISYFDVWGVGTRQVWAAGTVGTIVYSDGAAWSRLASGTTATITNLWASAPDDVWVIAAGGVRKWNGQAWTQLSTSGTRDLWGTAPDDVWVLGTNGWIQHWGPTGWTSYDLAMATPEAIWGTARDDVWVAGAGGALEHFDGVRWTPVVLPIPTRQALKFGWSLGRDDVWVAGDRGDLLRWDGVAWTNHGGVAPYNVAAAFGVGASQVWIYTQSPGTMQRFDGPGFERTVVPGRENLNQVWSNRPDDAWVVGDGGALYHWDGKAWTRGIAPRAQALNDVWASGPTDAWAVGAGGLVLHYDGMSWRTADIGATGPLVGVWGRGRDAVWIIGTSSEVFAYDGATWARVPGSAAWGTLVEIGGNAAGDVYVGQGSGSVFHLPPGERTAWRRLESGIPGGLTDVWTSAPNDLYALASGRTRHFDGAVWTDVAPPWPTDIWGTTPDDAWTGALGGRGLHYDGASWSPVELGAGADTFRFGGSGPGDVWAVGDGGIVLHMAHEMPKRRGGLCDEPITLYCNSFARGSTEGGPRRFDSYTCGTRSAVGREASYLLDGSVTGKVTVRVEPHGGDVDLIALGADAATGGCSASSCLEASQRDGAVVEQVDFTAEQGKRLYFVVDSAAPSDGVAYTISVICEKQ